MGVMDFDPKSATLYSLEQNPAAGQMTAVTNWNDYFVTLESGAKISLGQNGTIHYDGSGMNFGPPG